MCSRTFWHVTAERSADNFCLETIQFLTALLMSTTKWRLPTGLPQYKQSILLFGDLKNAKKTQHKFTVVAYRRSH